MTENDNRLTTLLIACLIAYCLILTLLSQLWYAGQTTPDFHFFNDWAEWRGIDKIGHFFSAFHISDVGVHLLGFAGVSRRKAIFWGSWAGILFQTPIEILDGFGIGYGFSWGDIIANFGGSLFLFLQYFLWNEIRIFPKFSFHPTEFAPLRPHLLGENIGQQFLKDYNGQTYWFAVDFQRFWAGSLKQSAIGKKQNTNTPISNFQLPISNLQSPTSKTVNRKSFTEHPTLYLPIMPSIGFGAENMIFARDSQNIEKGFTPDSQFYLSADINLEAIPVQHRFWQFVLFGLNKLHILFPALEYSALKGFSGHFWYF